MKRALPVMLATLLLCQSGFAADAKAEETALMKAPARNAALLHKVPGFKSADEKLYLGDRKVTEGVMVRRSEIRDGKLIIPPAGLVYSSRVNNIGTMTGLEVMMLGKLMPEVDEEAEMLIIRDRHMKRGDMVNLLPDGSRALHFEKGTPHPYGNTAADSANFKIMKSTGNYYATNFTVATQEPLQDVNSGKFTGLGLPEGRHSLDAAAPEKLQYQTFVGNSIFPSGNSYLIAANVTANEADVREFATPMLKRVWLASDPAVRGAYAAGESVRVGDATVRIDEVGKDNATITLTDKNGKSTTRKFENLNNPDATRYLPGTAADRSKFQMGTPDDTVRVQLAVLHPEGVITPDGKVRLDMYSGVFSFANPEPWARDPRFTVRPDTCASCRLLNEIVLENTQPIVIDTKTAEITGPEGYFKIVIDDFDGKNVKAWHFEDAEGNKSPNLASFANGAHIDLLANFENRSIGAHGVRNAEQALRRELDARGFVMKK